MREPPARDPARYRANLAREAARQAFEDLLFDTIIMAASLSGGTVDESTTPALRNLARMAAANLLGKD